MVLIVLGIAAYPSVKSVIVSQFVGVVVAREGRVEATVSGQGFVIRYETILPSPATGALSVSMAEGDRVRTGSEVARLSDTEERREAESRIGELEAQLARFNAEVAAEEAALASEIIEAAARVLSEADDLRTACIASDFSRMEETARGLAAAGKRRQAAESRLAVIRAERGSLEQDLMTARGTLEQTVFAVLAPLAGIVSYCLDGLEDTLSPESIGRYTTRQLLTMVGRSNSMVRDRLQAGDPVAKIIGDREAFVAVVVAGSQADRLAGVRDVTLRFPEFEGRRETPARLHHVGEREANGYCLVTYATTELLSGMVSARQVSATIILHAYSGTVIPRKAVVTRGGEDGVFILDRGTCRFRPVTVRGGNESEVVVTGLGVGTPVISTPGWVEEGMRIGG